MGALVALIPKNLISAIFNHNKVYRRDESASNRLFTGQANEHPLTQLGRIHQAEDSH
jgi:hypothetical protein